MSKNYFQKTLLSFSVLLTMSMTSCQGFVDAVLGTEDKPVTPTPATPVKPATSESKAEVTPEKTTITISSFADLQAAVTEAQNENFVKAIKAKAQVGEVYTIEIKSDAPLSTVDFDEISLPSIENADINLVFDKPVVTSENKPLKVTAEEKNSATSTKAVNGLTITIPGGASNVFLSVDMPETTVTLSSSGSKVNLKEVKSLTALNTFIIDDNVEVDNMDIEGGTVQVNEGGILESWSFAADHNDDQVNITEEGGIEPMKVYSLDENGNSVEQWQIASDGGEPYYAKSLKVLKGEADYSTVHFSNGSYDAIPLKTVIIGDGAVLRTNWVAMENIEGEGTAEIKYLLINPTSYTDDTEYGGDKFYEFNSDMSGVKNLKNVIISQPEINVHENFKAELDAKIAEGYIMHEPRLNMDIDGVVEGCTFKYNHVHFCQERSLTCPTIKNCKFVHVESKYSDEDIVEMRIPYIEGESSNSITFEGCEFSEGTKFSVCFYGNFGFESDGETHYTGYVNFINCKLGGVEFTGEDTSFAKNIWPVTGTKIVICFDGTPKYEADPEVGPVIRAIED